MARRGLVTNITNWIFLYIFMEKPDIFSGKFVTSLWKMAIEIADFSIENDGFPQLAT